MYENPLVGMLFVIPFILSTFLTYTEQSDAQLGPVPLPAPQLPLSSSSDKGGEDTDKTPSSPLTIQVINQQLNEGKNVVRIQVSPDRGINNCLMYYVIHSTSKIAQCVRESESIYKGLIEAEYPNQTIKVTASDNLNENISTQSTLSVHKAFSFADIPSIIRDWICKTILEC